MSGAAIKWARLQDVGIPHLQALLIAIAARVGPQGTTFVSQATLGRDVRLKPRQVRYSLATMERLGVIERKSRNTAKGRTSDLIILPLHKSFHIERSQVKAARNRKPSGTLLPLGSGQPSGTVVPGTTRGRKKELSHESETAEKAVGHELDVAPPLRLIRGGRS